MRLTPDARPSCQVVSGFARNETFEEELGVVPGISARTGSWTAMNFLTSALSTPPV